MQERKDALCWKRRITLTGSKSHPPTPQIIFYQSGLGTQDNIISQLVDGAYAFNILLHVI